MSNLSQENQAFEPDPHSATDNLSTSLSLVGSQKLKKEKVPRRILHFSDGILEEYSSDEEEEQSSQPIVDPKTLKWLPWLWFYVSTAAIKSWRVADFCGEKLAWFLGITSPKYQSAIDEYYRQNKEEDNTPRAKVKSEIRELSAIDVKVVETATDQHAHKY